MPAIMETIECLCTNLRSAALAGTAFYDRKLAPAGVKVTMFRLLRQIDRLNVSSLTDLAEATGLDRSTLGRNVRVLERDGLVESVQVEDGRNKAIQLTEEGRKALDDAAPLWAEAQSELIAMLGEDADHLLDVLRQVSKLNQAHAGKD